MTRDEMAALKAAAEIGAKSKIGAVSIPWRNVARLVAHVERMEAALDGIARWCNDDQSWDGFHPREVAEHCAHAATIALATDKEPDNG